MAQRSDSASLSSQGLQECTIVLQVGDAPTSYFRCIIQPTQPHGLTPPLSTPESLHLGSVHTPTLQSQTLH